MNLLWRAQSTVYRESVDLVAVQRWGDKIAVAKPMAFKLVEQDRHLAISAPTLELHPDSAQSLMQALWDAGVRPNDGAGSDAEVGALKHHRAFTEDLVRKLLDRLPSTVSGSRND